MISDESHTECEVASPIAHEYIALLENKLAETRNELEKSQLLNIQLGNRLAEMRELTSLFNPRRSN